MSVLPWVKESTKATKTSPKRSPNSWDKDILQVETSTKRKKRVLLKLSGESLMGERGFNIDPQILARLAEDLLTIHQMGIELALVVGGGNIFRGVSGSAAGMERTSADHMGMLATTINALALQNAIEQKGVPVRVQSAISMPQVAEPFIRRKAVRHLEKGRMVIFAAGTGNPFFSTDTAASLRAAEINADLLIKATKVDGVFSADPVTHPDAEHFKRLSYSEVIARDLKVMDMTAVSLCRENRIPIQVFSVLEPGALVEVMQGESRGTLIEED
ncbi:MAG: UMP kinase [Magnetococcales bacterium]|nr:UMP kinase [Magnetococcales bacterium]